MQRKKSTRREMLKQTSAAAAGAICFPYIVPSTVFGGKGRIAPNDRIVMGCIGVGGKGTGNMRAFMHNPEVQIAAVCDVENRSNRYYGGGTAGREPAKALVEKYYSQKKDDGKYKGCDAYRDFRELLQRDDIDAVSVGTPDHWHGLITVAAAKAGKHIYCEKPLTNTITGGRAAVDAAQENNRFLQTGSHERSNDSIRYACELVRNGYIGKLHTMRVNLPVGQAHHQKVMAMAKEPQPRVPVPDGFDYNMWLGPAPDAPFQENRCHFWWRFILAYGGGEMTDRGAHVIDIGQLGNGTDDTGPVTLKASGKRPTNSMFNTFMEFDFECEYADGVRMIGGNGEPRGIKFEGDEGWIFVHIHGGKLEANPASLLEKKIKEDEIHLGRSKGHHKNFIEAIRGRNDLMASGEVGHRTATICHLLNIAMLTGEKLQWDPENERVTNSETADWMLGRPMRAPWQLSADWLCTLKA
jgi:predicted dehydrogenase